MYHSLPSKINVNLYYVNCRARVVVGDDFTPKFWPLDIFQDSFFPLYPKSKLYIYKFNKSYLKKENIEFVIVTVTKEGGSQNFYTW